jgi:hypothetical protein
MTDETTRIHRRDDFKMPTAGKRRSESKSRAPRAKRATARTTIVASLADLNTRLGARTEYRIYPSIGIARIGDCKDAFMIGPEAPGMVLSGSTKVSSHRQPDFAFTKSTLMRTKTKR